MLHFSSRGRRTRGPENYSNAAIYVNPRGTLCSDIQRHAPPDTNTYRASIFEQRSDLGPEPASFSLYQLPSFFSSSPTLQEESTPTLVSQLVTWSKYDCCPILGSFLSVVRTMTLPSIVTIMRMGTPRRTTRLPELPNCPRRRMFDPAYADMRHWRRRGAGWSRTRNPPGVAEDMSSSSEELKQPISPVALLSLSPTSLPSTPPRTPPIPLYLLYSLQLGCT